MFDLFVWRVLLRLMGLEVVVSGLLFVTGLSGCFGCGEYRSRFCCSIGIWVFFGACFMHAVGWCCVAGVGVVSGGDVFMTD